jgi:ATP synthase protein I
MANKNNFKENYKKEFSQKIARKERRKEKARRNKDKNIWFGLGMFGIVGWSVSIPILLLLAIGIWIDSRWPSRISWTLTLLFIGVVLGCLNAWYWVTKEQKKIEEDRYDQ